VFEGNPPKRKKDRVLKALEGLVEKAILMKNRKGLPQKEGAAQEGSIIDRPKGGNLVTEGRPG